MRLTSGCRSGELVWTSEGCKPDPLTGGFAVTTSFEQPIYHIVAQGGTSGASTGGSVYLTSGFGVSSSSGALLLASANAGAGGVSGSVSLVSGDSTAGASGAVTIASGVAQTDVVFGDTHRELLQRYHNEGLIVEGLRNEIWNDSKWYAT